MHLEQVGAEFLAVVIATSSPGLAIPWSAASPAQWSSRLRSSVPKSLCTAVTPNSRLSRRTVFM